MSVTGNYRRSEGGASQTSASLTGGMKLGEHGNIVGYLELTNRDSLVAGQRDWAQVKFCSERCRRTPQTHA